MGWAVHIRTLARRLVGAAYLAILLGLMGRTVATGGLVSCGWYVLYLAAHAGPWWALSYLR
jgi:hypothetical protein